jgi:glutamate synthase domain-containing protein 1
VIGLLVKDPDLEPALGRMVVPMLTALGDRGPDSTGLGVYGRPEPGRCRVSFGSDAPVDWMSFALDVERGSRLDAEAWVHPSGAVVRVDEANGPALAAWAAAAWPAVRMLGSGRALSLLKDTGRPEEVCARHGVEGWEGLLALGHTRMATESAVTVLHSHPFAPTTDLCVVHNGSFSNYRSVRRRLEAAGVTFDSDNDSEVGARFLASRLAAGDDLDEGVRWLAKEMDGFFTLVITTGDAMSVVRDAFACKPAVVAETDAYVAVASEYRALAHLPGVEGARVFEPQPEEVYTWNCLPARRRAA